MQRLWPLRQPLGGLRAQACAFIHQQFESLERKAHGRSRDLDNEDELYFGVSERMFCAQLQQPVEGAQWTGIVSTLGVRALEQNLVDAVLCVQQSPEDRFTPMPVLARTPEEVLAARVNKPTLSNNLSVLEQLPGSGIKRLLAIGVGCQTQALRAVQDSLGLEELYVLGMPCVDNVSREGLQTFGEHQPFTRRWCTTSSCRTSAFTSATATAAPRRFPSLG